MRMTILLIALNLLSQGPALGQSGAQGDALRDPREVHLAEVRQLTTSGQNAEAYWSPDGSELIFQSTGREGGCDQIYRLRADGSGERRLVSTGEGRTTCAYFTFPEGERILYASTHLAGPECPPEPDFSQGYVWPLYGTFEIFSAKPDGSDLVRLTENDAYDAEATVCPLDGSIIFTSTRDGDLELYRTDADGSNVRRLTEAPGYDGGAFFSADCKQIVWRASRPRGEALEDYQRLLAQGLVRPSKLELWVAEADGTRARQITYLDSASFAPFFFPSGERIIFSSNHGDPTGREFDLWAIDTDGTDLERITYTREFDGFPIFSPDGRYLAFASNRNNERPRETNIFVARWVEAEPAAEEGAADRYMGDVAWLAGDAREGRGIGTQGLREAADWLATRFREIGLEPAGEDGTYRQRVDVPYAVEMKEGTALAIDGEAVAEDAFRPASFSTSAAAAAEVVPVGYGITAEEHGLDDYAGLDVAGKIVAVRRFTPEGPPFDATDVERRFSDLRYKAFTAREHGAVGVIVVDLPVVPEATAAAAQGAMPPSGAAPAGEAPAGSAPAAAAGTAPGGPGGGPGGEGAGEGGEGGMPDEAPLPALEVDAGGDAGLPVVVATRAVGAALFDGGHHAEMAVELERKREPSHNIVGVVRAGKSPALLGALAVGAHYDHLGYGDRGSMAPDSKEPHNGADDNASGTAALLEVARAVAARRDELQRDVYFLAFTAEESGILGSTHFTRQPTDGLALDDLVAMLNMDMVGRLRNNRLSVLGVDSAEEWREMMGPACDEARLACGFGGDGYGPSDQTPFYAAGVPVLHFFTGVHDDYHRPSDDAERINAAGGARVAHLVADVAVDLAARPEPLTYKSAPAPPPEGDVRSYGASLGTIPEYMGAEEGVKGVALSGVRPGSAAEAAGMDRGDVLVELAGHEIGDIYDFVFVLRQSKPGEKATAVVERDGRRIEMVVTFGASRRRP